MFKHVHTSIPRSYPTLFTLLFVFIHGTHAFADGCISTLFATNTKGQSSGAASYGHIAYVADLSSYSVIILDVSDPYKPMELNSLSFPDWVFDVIVVDETLYVCDRFDGIFVYSLANPAAPELLDHFDDPRLGIADTLVVDGSFAYVVDQQNGLVILDISDPSSITDVAWFSTDGFPAGIEYDQGYVYLAMSSIQDGVVIVDVRDPLNPTYIDELITPSFAMDLIIEDGIAYIADNLGGLAIADVRDPEQAELISSIHTGGRAWDLLLVERSLLVASYDLIVAIDVIDPSTPRLLGEIHTPGQARGITWTGSVGVVADGSEGYQVISFDQNCLSVCRADINRDGRVDYFDFSDWLTFYYANTTRADTNGDGIVDKQDAISLLASLNGTCEE